MCSSEDRSVACAGSYLCCVCLHSPKAPACLYHSPRQRNKTSVFTDRFPHAHICPPLSTVLSVWVLIWTKVALLFYVIWAEWRFKMLSLLLLQVLSSAFSKIFLFFMWKSNISVSMRQLYPISESLLSNSPPGCASLYPHSSGDKTAEMAVEIHSAPPVAGMGIAPHPSALLGRQCWWLSSTHKWKQFVFLSLSRCGSLFISLLIISFVLCIITGHSLDECVSFGCLWKLHKWKNLFVFMFTYLLSSCDSYSPWLQTTKQSL